MSYRFKENESVSQAVERIALEQLDEALEQTKARIRLDEAVHDTRVCFKKLRALIRLVRDEVGGKEYRRENVFYRNLNRKLSKVRDTAALTEILDKLVERFSEELAKDAFDATRKSLSPATSKKQTEKREALLEVRRTLPESRKQVKRWSIGNNGFSTLGSGITRIYRRGRKGFRKAKSNQTVESLHEWRKDAKYLWYHISLLRPLWPKALKAFARQIENLVDYLSDDHDLAMLRARVLAQSSDLTHDHEAEALMALIDKRRAELRAEAWILGDRIYAEKPKAFEMRLHEYWQAWQDEQKITPIAAR